MMKLPTFLHITIAGSLCWYLNKTDIDLSSYGIFRSFNGTNCR